MFAARITVRRLLATLIVTSTAVAMTDHSARALLPSAAADRTNSPPLNVTCNRPGCHTPPATGADQGSVDVTGLPACYEPGTTYTLNVTVADPASTRWGFELSAQYNEGNENDKLSAGTLANVAGQRTDIVPSTDGLRSFITHKEDSPNGDGTYDGQATSATWTIKWTAPAARTTPVCIYVAGVGANGNGGRSGDRTYLKKVCLMSCQPVPTQRTTWGWLKNRFYR